MSDCKYCAKNDTDGCEHCTEFRPARRKKRKKADGVLMPDIARSGEFPPKNESSLADLANLLDQIRGPLVERTVRTVMSALREKRLQHQSDFWRRHYGNNIHSYLTTKSEVEFN